MRSQPSLYLDIWTLSQRNICAGRHVHPRNWDAFCRAEGEVRQSGSHSPQPRSVAGSRWPRCHAAGPHAVRGVNDARAARQVLSLKDELHLHTTSAVRNCSAEIGATLGKRSHFHSSSLEDRFLYMYIVFSCFLKRSMFFTVSFF